MSGMVDAFPLPVIPEDLIAQTRADVVATDHPFKAEIAVELPDADLAWLSAYGRLVGCSREEVIRAAVGRYIVTMERSREYTEQG
jgi:hypothetical protein